MLYDITPVILVLNDEYFLPYGLESIKGFFEKYIIYDVGSSDQTPNIIDYFIETSKEQSIKPNIIHKRFDTIPSRQVQGTFRNSMIAEAGTNWTFMLDGDEVYTKKEMNSFEVWWNYHRLSMNNSEVIYGIFKRLEISEGLTQKYDRDRSHHRVYHRTATFGGPHPGEYLIKKATPNNELWIPNMRCFHFHNALRSSQEDKALKRKERKTQATYRPGNLIDFNLLEELPILRKPIHNFPVNPNLEKLQYELFITK